MKKSLLTSVCVLALAGAAFAQGTLNWNTMSPVGITVQINNSLSPLAGGTPSVSGTYMGTAAGSFYFELLYNTMFTGSQIAAPSAADLLVGGSWIDSGLEAKNATASAGKIVPVVANIQAVPLGTWAGGIGALGGTTNNIVLVGWSSNLGTTWSAALDTLANWNASIGESVYFGVSTTGYIVPNIAPATGASLFSSAAGVNGLPINSVNMQLYLVPMEGLPTPEPGTMALMGLGGFALWMLRRRKT